MAIPTNIRAVALDVDGTLTDGSFSWDATGEESKRFHFFDVMGISRARLMGVVFALISGEDSRIVDRYAKKVRIAHIYKGCKQKDEALRAFAQTTGIPLADIAYMGDDVNDLPALRIAGLRAAPVTAHEAVLREAQFVSKRPAGAGAVRCLIDHLWGDTINR